SVRSSPRSLKPPSRAKVTGKHFGGNSQYNEVVETADPDHVRKQHRDVPGDQSRQKLGGKNRP
ncbi:MAG: hypothetical protein WBW37_16170, partial [Methyloceanibacter sp.]